jgi:microcystin degradation protein MlrC
MPDIAIVRFGHEGNSFGATKATIADFRAFEWAKGPETIPFYKGTNTEIGGVISFFETRPDWTPHYLRCTFATPSGEVERAAYDEILAEILADLKARRWDAVFFGQHGSMQVEGIDHADHEILQRVREVIGDTPLAASYDLHANITQAEIDLCDITVGYKCHPHTDMAETAEKALRLLLDVVAGRIRPVGVVLPMNSLLPSINARTTDGPMAEVAAFARALEESAGLLDLTVYQGYAYGDRAHAGASVVAYADGDRALAAKAAKATMAELRRVRDRLFVSMPSAEEALQRALAMARQGKGPVAIVDSADYPGSGANADTPGFLRTLLAAKPDVPTAFVFFFDPVTVAKAAKAGVGATIETRLGGRLTDAFGPPVAVTARVDRLTDGRIVHTGVFCNGLEFNYGPTAVLDVEGIKVVVTTECLTVNDPSFFALHGIDVDRLGILAMKAKNQFRSAFPSTFSEMIYVDIPGPAAYDYSGLPFRRVPAERLAFDTATNPPA